MRENGEEENKSIKVKKKRGEKVVRKKDDLKGGVCGLLCGMPTQGQRRPGS